MDLYHQPTPSLEFFWNSPMLIKAGVSVKFLMVGETNSMVGYHLKLH